MRGRAPHRRGWLAMVRPNSVATTTSVVSSNPALLQVKDQPRDGPVDLTLHLSHPPRAVLVHVKALERAVLVLHLHEPRAPPPPASGPAATPAQTGPNGRTSGPSIDSPPLPGVYEARTSGFSSEKSNARFTGESIIARASAIRAMYSRDRGESRRHSSLIPCRPRSSACRWSSLSTLIPAAACSVASPRDGSGIMNGACSSP
jgi:hypothetical protein